MEILKSDKNISRWVYHFERQAKIGISDRSFFNNKVIIVSKLKKDNSESDSIGHAKANVKSQIPDIVSPVQQVVEQAEEEIRREDIDQGGNIINGKGKSINKRKLSYKGRVKSKKFKDIFTVK